MKITNVLFPTDFSENSLYALPYAVDMAKTYNAKLHLIYVIHDIGLAIGMDAPQLSLETIYEEIEAEAKGKLEGFGLDQRKGLNNIACVVLRGVPYEEIIKYAKTHSVDLIVIGTHGRKGVDRVLLGSTAERVVRNSSCPVLTVRKPG